MSPFGAQEAQLPEQSLFIQVASAPRILAANVIDAFLLFLLLGGVVLGLSNSGPTPLLRGAHPIDSGLLWVASQWAGILIASITVFAGVLLYQCSPMAVAGYTPGRRIAGLVLVHRRGRELTRGRLIVRSLLSLVSFGLLMMGYFLPVLDRYNRTFHDWCTQTILVRRRLKIP